MKKTLIIAAAMCGVNMVAQTANVTQEQIVVDGVSVSDVKIERDGGTMSVEMLLDMKELKVDGNRAVLLTPRLANGGDSLDLPSVGIYGRRRYYHYVRNGESMLTGDDEISYKASKKPDNILYKESLPYEEWMDGARLSIHRMDYGCCNSLLAEQTGVLGNYAEAVAFFPEMVYVQPKAERVKSRSLEGSAYIAVPVDKTAIYPDYRRNKVELGKIQATVDSVRGDRDVTITSVWLKGYASPEGTYAHNTELAIGRTEALKKHIGQLYKFDDDIITTDYEPENWAGLRDYVEQSEIAHRDEILAIIDSGREPDAREWKLKSTYPDEYRELLRDCYPALRHTDYRIAYNIRGYSDPMEIKRVMATQPQKLSLNEFYILAQEYEPGSDEFTEVFETAVLMYPADETANLNAANAAMLRGDNAGAQRYLAKAGGSPEAVYARGALAIIMEDYATARRCLEEASELGVGQASEALKQIEGK